MSVPTARQVRPPKEVVGCASNRPAHDLGAAIQVCEDRLRRRLFYCPHPCWLFYCPHPCWQRRRRGGAQATAVATSIDAAPVLSTALALSSPRLAAARTRRRRVAQQRALTSRVVAKQVLLLVVLTSSKRDTPGPGQSNLTRPESRPRTRPTSRTLASPLPVPISGTMSRSVRPAAALVVTRVPDDDG